ncbi:MAG: polyprenol monophosphomannose synthase [Bacteroidales bacterium]|nr:polyprenol monophosphomannose synthase [Bacteroidales bacterium]
MKESLIIIPTYNERENIADLIKYIINLPYQFDILVVDDNSPDNTADIVKDLMKVYENRVYIIEREGKLGLGSAYITGFKWALNRNYEYIFEMDADFSHNPDDLCRMIEVARKNKPCMVIGSRYITGVNVINWPIERILMSYFGSVYVRKITGLPVKDTTAGFVCYHNEILRKINFSLIRMKGYGFQIEMKFNVWKMGYKIIEIPIVFTDRKKGTSKMSGGIFKEAILGVIKLKFSSFFKNYNVK